MEKSRAIELLEHLAWDRDIDRNPCGDALRMAIDALKAQHSSEGTTKGATSDLIDRQAAIDAAKEAVIADEQPYVENALKSVPSAQQENVIGEWVTYYKYDNFIGRYEWKRCSKCGKDMISHETDYCPNCGAHMRGEKDG